LRYLLLLPVFDRTEDRQEAAQMTGKIERQVEEHHTTLRLIGHLQAAHLEALRAQLESNSPRTVLDLDQVTLVDVEVVRFLGDCEAAGIAVLHGPPYIREWIRREQDRPG
jgi:ABC-type transporter Mla MlaB component